MILHSRLIRNRVLGLHFYNTGALHSAEMYVLRYDTECTKYTNWFYCAMRTINNREQTNFDPSEHLR
jgi:hypothetical protein